MSKGNYKKVLRHLQIGLVQLQRHVIRDDQRLLVLFEGRDASGKDGVIKRIVEHLSPRETRVVAPGRPSLHDERTWYFQRYVPHLPAKQEFVLFNRSWYNRAGVEHVMGYATNAEVDDFFATVREFESLLVRSGMRLYKYYLDIGRNVQSDRLRQRRNDPLKQWKISPVDSAALKHLDDYTKARNNMLERTHSSIAPWTIVNADNKKAARLAVIADILKRSDIKAGKQSETDQTLLFRFNRKRLRDGSLHS